MSTEERSKDWGLLGTTFNGRQNARVGLEEVDKDLQFGSEVHEHITETLVVMPGVKSRSQSRQ